MRDYNIFKTKVQDYMEYFCRRNDPKNIEDIVNSLMESNPNMDIDTATDQVVDIVRITDEEKTEKTFEFIADYWSDTVLSDGNSFGNVAIAKQAMINLAKLKLGQPGGNNPVVAIMEIIDIINAYMDILFVRPGGSYASCATILVGNINKTTAATIIGELPTMIIKANLIHPIPQNPGESNIDFTVRKQRQYVEITTEHIWKKYIESVTIDFQGITSAGTPTSELRTPTT
jgi:hypothetical protein